MGRRDATGFDIARSIAEVHGAVHKLQDFKHVLRTLCLGRSLFALVDLS